MSSSLQEPKLLTYPKCQHHQLMRWNQRLEEHIKRQAPWRDYPNPLIIPGLSKLLSFILPTRTEAMTMEEVSLDLHPLTGFHDVIISSLIIHCGLCHTKNFFGCQNALDLARPYRHSWSQRTGRIPLKKPPVSRSLSYLDVILSS